MVGAHLLGEIADRTGLSSGYSAAVPWTGERAPGQDRGRLFAQVAVMLAAGGRSVADMAALRDQPELFGDVASAPTIWRAVHEVDESVLTALRAARATAREVVWAAGGAPEEVVLDVDASLVEIHSENKEGATSHYKQGFGFHPMFCFLDATGEALAGNLRPGNAAANSGADQLTVVDDAIAQLPAAWQAGTDPAMTPTRWSTRCWCGPTPPAQSGASSTGSWPATASSPSEAGSPPRWTLRSPPSHPERGSPPGTPTVRSGEAPRSPSSTSR